MQGAANKEGWDSRISLEIASIDAFDKLLSHLDDFLASSCNRQYVKISKTLGSFRDLVIGLFPK
jgi:hypothetical protein